MSTRAVYTFRDRNFGELRECHVYKHHDGYPAGAAQWIENTLIYSWPLPRFESTEAAAAFIAGNKKKGGGGVYCTSHWNMHDDLEFRYEIEVNGNELMIRAFEISDWQSASYGEIFAGTLSEFKAWGMKS